MKIYLATWMEDNQGKSLTKAKNCNRLLSYFFILSGKSVKGFLKAYVLKGQIIKEGK